MFALSAVVPLSSLRPLRLCGEKSAALSRPLKIAVNFHVDNATQGIRHERRVWPHPAAARGQHRFGISDQFPNFG